jgi:hypothetical protein
MAILAECSQSHKRQKHKNKRCVCGKNLDSAKRAENPKNKVKLHPHHHAIFADGL